MRIFRNTVFFFAFLLFSCTVVDNGAANIAIFSDHNTDILLLLEGDTYVLVGYGGSNHGSAGCVIKSRGSLNNKQLGGFLHGVQTDIISYEITDTLEYKFEAHLLDSTLTVISGEVFGICGLGTIFTREYSKVGEKGLLHKKTDDFIELMLDSEENEELLSALKKFRSRPK